jgi:predicted nucleic acid-binding protein
MADNVLIFIDSNIWLYSFIDTDRRKYKIARRLLKKKRKNIVISIQVVNEVCFNLKRKAGFVEAQIEELIDSFFNRYKISEFDKNLLIQGSKLRRKYSLSFWDSLIIAAAIRGRCHTIYSEDMQHNQVIEDKLRIINPFNPESR